MVTILHPPTGQKGGLQQFILRHGMDRGGKQNKGKGVFHPPTLENPAPKGNHEALTPDQHSAT